jgi:hypothetical protein
VTFASTTPTVCTVSGSTVAIRAAGTCTILAAQAGNISYNAAASVSRSFIVGLSGIVRYTYDATGNVIKIEPAGSQ